MGLERIKDIRKAKGMTIDELSEKSGVPVSTIKKISAGITRNPNLETVRAIARALNCTLDDFDDPIETDRTKKSPEPDDPGSEAMYEELGFKIYKTLLEYGYVSPGQDLTEDQIDFLDHITAIISAYFNN